MEDVFSFNNYNVIEDDDSYYFFRCLEENDIYDIKNNKIEETNGVLNKLRTYREHYNETHIISSRYDEKSEISLDEMWSHIKKNFYRGTNCISFSTNCNVSIDYDYGEGKYLMIQVPKAGIDNVYYAGKYMLNELDKYLDDLVITSSDDDIHKLISRVTNAKTSSEIYSIVMETGKEHEASENLNSILKRFNKKQFFNEQQQLEYDRIIGKLTVLELTNNIDRVLPRTSKNSSLISTISMAYSSGEVIVYGEKIPENNKMVSKTIIDLFSILQQAEERGLEKEHVKILKMRVLEYAKEGYQLENENGRIVFTNGINKIDLGKTTESILYNENNIKLDSYASVRQIYDLTEGSVDYYKSKRALDFAFKTSISKLKTEELCKILRSISADLNLEKDIERIKVSCFAVDPEIINRRNNSGFKLCESVNIDMNKDDRINLYSNEEQKNMLIYLNRLTHDNLMTLISSSGLSVEKNLCENILEKSNRKGINRYYAETIFDMINFNKIFNEDRQLSNEEREFLVSKMEPANCVNLYETFKELGVSDDDICSYIFNLFVEDGYKANSFMELSNSDSLKEILENNINNLNKKITALRVDRALGIIDNFNMIDDSVINLRDYQKDAVDNIDAIFMEKRFTGVILPTGAGKSFVAMTEMLKYKDKNIIYYAPNTQILTQIKRHLLKNVFDLNVVPEEEVENVRMADGKLPTGYITMSQADEYIKMGFPHLKLCCYQSMVGKEDEYFQSHDADLIIFDEIHRTGADEWNTKIKKLINYNPNAKILGITATPIRDDATHKNMMDEFARLSGDYTQKEIIQKKHLSSELYLYDAMQEGIVISPNLITFDYTLENSDQYKETEAIFKNLEDGVEKEKVAKVLKDMQKIIKKSKQEGMTRIIEDAFEKNSKKSNGRYIVFLPMNDNKNISTEDFMKEQIELVKSYFKGIDEDPEVGYLLSNRKDPKQNDIAIENFERDSDHLKLIFAYNMLNEGVHVDGIDGILMLRPISANSKILYSQQTGRCIYGIVPNVEYSEDSVPLIFDVYNNYMAHNMDREANKSNTTTDLQKMRYAYSWIKKHHGYFPDINSEDKIEYRKAATLKKIQFKYQRYIDNPINNNLTPSEMYEIEEILNLGKQINLWEREIGDRIIEDTSIEESNRVNTFKLSGEQKRFIELYNEVKEAVPNTKIKVGSLRIRNTISTLELLSEYGFEINNDTIKNDTILEDILNTRPGIMNYIKEELQVDLDFKIGEEYQYVKEMFYTKHKCFEEFSIRTLRNCGVFHPFINRKGVEVSSINSTGFITRGPNTFINFNIYSGTEYDLNGLDVDGYDELGFKYGEGLYNRYGFNREGIHYKTNTFLNEYGFDMYGDYYEFENGEYNNLGKYNKEGFDIRHLWYEKTINKKGDEVYKYTGRKYDKKGYDFYGFNKYNFDREGYYWKTLSTKKDVVDEYDPDYIQRIKTDRKTDDYGFYTKKLQENGTLDEENGFNIGGLYLNGSKYNKYGFNRDKLQKNGSIYDINDFDFYGTHARTKQVWDEHYFDRDGYFYKQVNNNRIKTENKYDNRYFNNKGFLYEKDENGVYILTNKRLNYRNFDRNGYFYQNGEEQYKKSYSTRKYDNHWFDIDGYLVKEINGKIVRSQYKTNENNFDCDGYYYISGGNGTLFKTDRKYDDRGFNIDKICESTGAIWNELGEDINRSIKTYHERKGFDQNNNYWEKQEDGTYKNIGKYNTEGYDINGNRKIGQIGDEPIVINRKNYDQNNNYWKQQEDGSYINLGKYNTLGYDINGNRKIGEIGDEIIVIDPRGFDKYGDYWEEQEDGKYENMGKYDSYGLDKEGRRHIETVDKVDIIINDDNVDEKGIIWKQQEDGTYQKEGIKNVEKYDRLFRYVVLTDKGVYNRVNLRGFDKNKDYWEKQEDGTYINKGKLDKNNEDAAGNKWYFSKNTDEKIFIGKTNRKGFNENKIHYLTNAPWNPEGKDDSDDYHTYKERKGFDQNGNYWIIEDDKCINTYSKYNDYDFDVDGNHKNGTRYNDDGFDCNRIHVKTGTEYNEELEDIDGNFLGDIKNSTGHYVKHTKIDGVYLDEYNFDYQGNYYNVEENNVEFTNSKYNDRGFKKDCTYKETGRIYDDNRFTIDKKFTIGEYDHQYYYQEYNIDGFDCDGYYHRLQEDGTYIDTGNKFDDNGFSINGLYMKQQEDGTYIETDSKYNDKGIDKYGFDKEGIFVETGLPYNKNMFKSDGTCVYTGTKYNLNGFNIDGINNITGTYLDIRGFNSSKINIITHEEYDERGRDIFRNQKFDLDSNDLPYEVYVTKKYFQDMSASNKKEIISQLIKYEQSASREIKQNPSELFDSTIYRGVEMCPELREMISSKLGEMQTVCTKKEMKLIGLKRKMEGNQEQIEAMNKQIKAYKSVIAKYSVVGR